MIRKKKFALVTFGNEESYGLLFVGGELELLNQHYRYFDGETDRVFEEINRWQPDYICFSPMTVFYRKAIAICREITKSLKRAKTVFGGHHAMSCPDIIDDPEVDIVVVGPIRGAVEKIVSGQTGIIRTTPTNPGDMPVPARERCYADITRMGERYRKFMLSTLGCPWNCSYCSSSAGHMRDIFGRDNHQRYYLRRRPLENLVDEAKTILRWNTHEIEWVDDDIFYGADTETWIPEFVDVWEREIGIPIYVSTTSRSILKVSDRVLQSMRRIVNCVGVGVQAIRPESLRLLNRAWDNEATMKAAYDRLGEFGYSVNLQAIIGLPVDEPVEDAMDTIKGLQRIGPGSVCSVYPLLIFPGTRLEDHCRKKNIALNDLHEGDTNTGIPSILFGPETTKKIRNLCKLATFFVKYSIDERWMRVLINMDIDDKTSHALSMEKYFECVKDRLKSKGVEIFNEIQNNMNLRY